MVRRVVMHLRATMNTLYRMNRWLVRIGGWSTTVRADDRPDAVRSALARATRLGLVQRWPHSQRVDVAQLKSA